MILTYETSTRVYLPPEYEFSDKLESIFDAAGKEGATEFSTIGPSVVFEKCDMVQAKRKMQRVMNSLGFVKC